MTFADVSILNAWLARARVGAEFEIATFPDPVTEFATTPVGDYEWRQVKFLESRGKSEARRHLARQSLNENIVRASCESHTSVYVAFV